MRLIAAWLGRHLRRPKRNILRAAIALLLLYATDISLYRYYSHVIPRPARDLDSPFLTQCQDPVLAAASAPREKAIFTMLARNADLESARKTVENIEQQFNQWFHYPILFLNNEEWSDEFVSVLTETASGEASFEVIPKENWTFPEWINPEEARGWMADQEKRGVYKGGIESYHHMCRFYSGYVGGFILRIYLAKKAASW